MKWVIVQGDRVRVFHCRVFHCRGLLSTLNELCRTYKAHTQKDAGAKLGEEGGCAYLSVSTGNRLTYPVPRRCWSEFCCTQRYL